MKFNHIFILALLVASPAIVHADSWGQPEVAQSSSDAEFSADDSAEIEPVTEPAPLSDKENRELAAEMKKLERQQQAKSAQQVQKLVSVVFSAILKSANQNQSKTNLERRVEVLQRQARVLRQRELQLKRELRRQQSRQQVIRKKPADPIEQLFYSMVLSSLDPKDQKVFRQKLGLQRLLASQGKFQSK